MASSEPGATKIKIRLPEKLAVETCFREFLVMTMSTPELQNEPFEDPYLRLKNRWIQFRLLAGPNLTDKEAVKLVKKFFGFGQSSASASGEDWDKKQLFQFQKEEQFIELINDF